MYDNSFVLIREVVNVLILAQDMGYTNAQGTHQKMLDMIEEEGIAFALHGGDISYADDFTYGLFECIEDYHCYK
jgi:hypothetical protein